MSFTVDNAEFSGKNLGYVVNHCVLYTVLHSYTVYMKAVSFFQTGFFPVNYVQVVVSL